MVVKGKDVFGVGITKIDETDRTGCPMTKFYKTTEEAIWLHASWIVLARHEPVK